MRVAYITGLYPAISHTFINREIDALRGAGVEVQTMSLRAANPESLLTERDRDEAARTWVVLPVSVPTVVRRHLRSFFRRPRRYLTTLRKAMALGDLAPTSVLWRGFYFLEAVLVADELSAKKIDHVHAHFANSASWVALLAAQLNDSTWSFTMHGPTEFDDVGHFALEQKIREAAFVSCIGDYCRSQLMRFSSPADWSKLIVVRCAIEPDRYAPRGDRPSGLVGASRVLSVARLSVDKGLPVLIDAVGILVAQGWKGSLDLVGDGPDRDALEALVESRGLAQRIRFRGSVDQETLPSVYRSADIFVLSSFAEGIPVVLMEAMATGLPVVATTVMGISELVQDGRNGFLVAPARADLLASRIAQLDADPELRARLARDGVETVAETFSYPAAAEPLVAQLRDISS